VTLLGQGVGLGDPQRSLPTPAMLGFWDSVNGQEAFDVPVIALQCMRPLGFFFAFDSFLLQVVSSIVRLFLVV